MPVLGTAPPPAVAQQRETPPSMVERMTSILDAFDCQGARLSLEDVARHTGLPRSTAHRILDQLVRFHWLEHTGIGYCLGQRALGLGGRDGSHGELREAAAPRLHELQMRTGLVVHLAVLDAESVYYLDKVGGRFAASVPSRVGGHAPAHVTALGKAMLARMEPEQVDGRIGGAIGRSTGRTVADLPTLHRELSGVRRRFGLAFDREECFPDIACAAAAIRGPDGPVAAVSVVGDRRMPVERAAPLVLDAARQCESALFPDRNPRLADRDDRREARPPLATLRTRMPPSPTS